jgi:hypothetical protein
MLSLEF